jgi:hypothetical protein
LRRQPHGDGRGADAGNGFRRGDQIVKKLPHIPAERARQIQVHSHELIRCKAVVDGHEVLQAPRQQSSPGGQHHRDRDLRQNERSSSVAARRHALPADAG